MTLPTVVSKARSSAIVPALPALLLLMYLWLVAYRKVEFHLISERAFNFWQSLGRSILEAEGFEALFNLHTQPPGFNALQLIDLQVTPDSHKIMGLALLGMAFLTVLLVVAGIRNSGISDAWSSVAGLLLVLLPAFLAYTLWPFSTLPVMLAVALFVWGASLLVVRPVVGAFGMGTGLLLAFLFRPSFLWFTIAAILVCIGWWITRNVRERKKRLLSLAWLAMAMGGVLALQAHYFLSFGLYSTSSWTGENIVKALTQSGKLSVGPDFPLRFQNGSCEYSVAEALSTGAFFVWRPVEFEQLPNCADLEPLGFRTGDSWNSPEKEGQYDGVWLGNFNWEKRLQHSRVWNEVARELVLTEPAQVASMVFLGPTSSVAIYLRPAHEVEVEFQRVVYENPLGWIGGPFSAIFAPLAIGITIVAWPVLLRQRERPRQLLVMMTLTSSIVIIHLVPSLLEFGENQRFQAEMMPALMTSLFLSMLILTKGGNFTSSDESGVSNFGPN